MYATVNLKISLYKVRFTGVLTACTYLSMFWVIRVVLKRMASSNPLSQPASLPLHVFWSIYLIK